MRAEAPISAYQSADTIVVLLLLTAHCWQQQTAPVERVGVLLRSPHPDLTRLAAPAGSQYMSPFP